MTEAARRVLVGRIVGLHGVQGWVKLESWTEPRMRIFDYQPWLLVAAPGGSAAIEGAVVEDAVIEDVVLEGVKGHAQGKGIVAQLPGVNDREQAAAMVGRDIHVARTQLPPPAEGDFYWVDMEGLEVTTTTGVSLGRVSHLFATGANDVVVVRDGSRERLIPFVRDSVVVTVDLAAQQMVVDWDPDF